MLLKPKGLTVISILAVLQSTLMNSFFYVMLLSNIDLISIPQPAFQAVESIFLAIGLLELLSAYGLWRLKRVG